VTRTPGLLHAMRIQLVDPSPAQSNGEPPTCNNAPRQSGAVWESLNTVAPAPDVVLMDINLPGASGVEATRQTTQISPATAVLVDDDDSVFTAMAAGARGYVLKGASAAEITAALRTVASGGAVFGAGVASRLLARTPPRPSASTRPDDLTAREREVLDLLVEGASNRQIARSLELSLKTVQNHVSRILDKLQAADRTQAALRARGISPSPY
jgi:DNA-binding NarL/FixJ family response regulator